MASQLGIDLDRLNISVLNVEGVDFLTYIKILNAMEIEWSMRTDNDILKIPKKDEYRFAGVERAVTCLEAGCIIEDVDKKEIDNRKKFLRGFKDPNNIPEESENAVKWLREFMENYSIQLADKDLETDLMKSPLRESLIKYYGDNDDEAETNEDDIIHAMQKHKALNMYHFLQKNKAKLELIKDHSIFVLLTNAKDYIVKNYGAYTDPT